MTLDRDRVAAALPSYEIGGELGRGGFGIVLEGRHQQLGREVAIKQLPRAFGADPAVRARFLAEARLLASLDHPHVVPVFDYVEQDGLCLLVMEKLSGGTVWSRFTSTGLTMDSACALVLATCAGLHSAHERGILHRDVKPENLMFSTTAVVKVTDFGIAKVLGGSRTLATRAGEVLGTPAYMAPEQAQAKELSVATDVYATGTMLYELLSGRLPFDDDGDALALLYRHVHEPPVPLAEVAPDVPEPLQAVVMRAIATDPASRHPTAEALGIAVAEAATVAWGPGWLGRSDLPVLAATAIVAVTERASGPTPAQAAGDVAVSGGGRGPAPPTEAETAVSTPAPGPPSVRVHPTVAVHTGAAPIDEESPPEFVPLHEVLERPPRPAVPALLAAALLALAVLLALSASASRTPTGTFSGALIVNGIPVEGDAPIELDLAKPVVVTPISPSGPPPPARVALEFSVAGLPLGVRSASVEERDGVAAAAMIDASGLRYVVAGEVRATLEFLDTEGRSVADRAFTVSSTQPSVLTIPGLGVVVLVLFVVAYAESLLRSRRRGRKRVVATVGMLLIGGLAGIVVVGLAWIVGGREPAPSVVFPCVALGAASGVAAVVAAGRVARRRRARRTR
jgi:hypothetical protein